MKQNTGFFERSALTQVLWQFRRELLMVGAFSMVANVLMLTPTLYMLQVYDRVLASQSELTLLVMSLLTLALFAVMAFAEWMRSRLLVATGMRLDEALSTQVFHASFDSHLSQSSSTASRALSDLIQIRQFLTGNGVIAFFDTPWTPIYLAVLFFLHPVLGVTGVVFAVLQGLMAWAGYRLTALPTQAVSQAQIEATSFVQGKLRNAEVLEAMGMVVHLRRRWQALQDRYLSQHVAAHDLTHRITAVSKWLRYTQQSLALGAGAWLVVEGQLSPGGMIAANVLMSRALQPIDLMVASWRQFMSMREAFLRIERLLMDFPPRLAELRRVKPVAHVVVQAMSAMASGRAKPILQDVSLDVPVGTVTAVMGPSGSGKSTLARVLVGIWPGVQGDVTLGGVPLQSWNRVELGPYIGYLPQDIELFDGTIADNIARFGRVDAEKVIAAAQGAGLHEMILRFAKGYDTPIGEAGHLLSGGQRQRIGLARALYGDPALVVLDEPNSNLDDAGEAALMAAVQALKARGATVFLITHRPAALGVVDRILILREGRVQAHGPRDAVLAALRAAQSPVPPAAQPQPA